MKFKGTVSVDLLNVRSYPGLTGEVLETLSKNTIIEIYSTVNGWHETKYNGHAGFVSGDYIDVLESEPIVKAKVIASKLNVRSSPNGELIGTLNQDSVIEVHENSDGWSETQFNGQTAYVSSDYLNFMKIETNKTGIISVDTLNVRSKPNTKSEILGKLSNDVKINIESDIGDWYEIIFNDQKAYIHSDYVDLVETDSVSETKVSTPLEPTNKLPLSGSSTEKKVARTWNSFGGLLEELSGSYQIDPGAALAVLCVESSGKGFEKQNDNRMIIRFENHLFWRYWGKKNSEIFHQHFKYGKVENGKNKVWLGHVWRKSIDDDFVAFHGSQSKEWEVLEFARSFDDTAALNCISMGAPQIMGFHAKNIGYKDVQAMFESFGSDIQGQIEGLFNFLDKRMINALQEKDFTRFAGYYNGSGQKVKYGGWIQKHYDAYNKIMT